MPWVTQSKGVTTFGSVVRVKGRKYIFLSGLSGNDLVKLNYYTFPIVSSKDVGIDDDDDWEVWKDEELFSKAHIPNHEKEDSCALGILDNLSGD